MDNYNKKILVTGGHLTPAVAVINELRSKGYNNFVWVGHKYNQAGSKIPTAEFNTISDLNIPFYNLRTGKLIRDWSLSTFLYGIKNLIFVMLGLLGAIRIILKERPTLVLSFGGYLALPIVVSARLMGIKVITHEQTLVVGMANKIISRFADRVLISWENSIKYFKNKNKVKFTGNPIRSSIFEIKDDSLIRNLDKSLPTILIYGGNQGAHEINIRVFEIINDLLKDFNVIHQTGNSNVTRDNERSKHIYASLPNEYKNRYVPVEYINQEQVGSVLNKADIIVGRSGANSIAEILALGKLCILIPIPHTSHDEQITNAKFVEASGLGIYLEQDTLLPQKLYQNILILRNQLNANKSANNLNLDEVRNNSKKLIKLDAAELVAQEVIGLL